MWSEATVYNPNTSDDTLDFELIDRPPVQNEASHEQQEIPDLVRQVLDIGLQLSDYRASHLEQQHQEAA